MEVLKDKGNCQLICPKSPNILRPKPLCLKRKPKRLASASQPLHSINTNISKSGPENSVCLRKSPGKCINPFRRTDYKRKREANSTDSEENSLLWQWTNKRLPDNSSNEDEKLSQPPSPVVPPAFVDEDAHSGFNNGKHFSLADEKDKITIRPKEKHLPVDWSLKTKIRLTSAKPFPWRSSFKTSEEASGTTGFVRCLHPDDKKADNLDSSHGAKLYQQCLVWMHPSLPWLNLFPRNQNRKITSNSSSPSLDLNQQEILHSNWCDSFRSLYQLVRTCQCPYFYMCAPTFTVMFRSGGVASIIELHAAISPTTRGLRNALQAEGVEFTTPLRQGSENGDFTNIDDESTAANENCDKENKIETELEGGLAEEEEEETGMWLESLGLSQQDFPSLNSKRIKLQKEKKKNYDHRPESLVYIEGSETQALVNFLLNYPSCMSKLGPMAGVPPTLLAPTAFLGATLRSHTIRHGKLRTGDNELHTVELSGPLLPNTIQSLCSLLNSTQDGNFSAVLTHDAPTLAFTMLAPHSSSVPSAFATENLKDCGLPNSFVQQICSKNISDKGGLSNICVEDGLFSWT